MGNKDASQSETNCNPLPFAPGEKITPPLKTPLQESPPLPVTIPDLGNKESEETVPFLQRTSEEYSAVTLYLSSTKGKCSVAGE